MPLLFLAQALSRAGDLQERHATRQTGLSHLTHTGLLAPSHKADTTKDLPKAAA